MDPLSGTYQSIDLNLNVSLISQITAISEVPWLRDIPIVSWCNRNF